MEGVDFNLMPKPFISWKRGKRRSKYSVWRALENVQFSFYLRSPNMNTHQLVLITYEIEIEVHASRKTDCHCKVLETLFILKLNPTLNANLTSDKLSLY